MSYQLLQLNYPWFCSPDSLSSINYHRMNQERPKRFTDNAFLLVRPIHTGERKRKRIHAHFSLFFKFITFSWKARHTDQWKQKRIQGLPYCHFSLENNDMQSNHKRYNTTYIIRCCGQLPAVSTCYMLERVWSALTILCSEMWVLCNKEKTQNIVNGS